MPLSGSAFWACVLPVGKTNLYPNPSGERGTFGWTDVSVDSIGTWSDYQQFGAWAFDVTTDNAENQSVAGGGTWASGNGTAYTMSAYVRVTSGKRARLAVGTANNAITGASIAGSVIIDGGGTWHRYNVPYTETADQNRRLLVWGSDYDQDHIYLDGIQVEVGSLTTYLDGDQDGCYWLGAPHQSQSVRSGTYRGGGSVVALEDLGLKPYQYPGVGMPPQEITSQSFALQAGAEYQRSRAGERPFSITFQPILGTTQKGLHVTRKALINAFKPDAVSPQQPVRFWYTGGLGTVQIDAVYAGGLELGDMNSPMSEEGAIKFVAEDPYWYSTTQQGTALLSRVALGSVNYLAKRDPYGRWGTLGAAGSSVDNSVNALALYNGTLYLGGVFGSAHGTRSGALAFYNTLAGAFGTFGGTVQANGVSAITTTPDGTVIFGGAFTNISGLSNTRFIARFANGFATIVGGTTTAAISALNWTAGTLLVGGDMAGVAGTTTGGLALWRPSGYGSTSGGTFNGEVLGIGVGLDKRVYVTTGDTPVTAGGTAVNYIAQWNGAWGSMGSGFQAGGAAGARPVAVGPNGVVYVGGGFGSAGGGSAQNVAQWNGQQWFNMAGGLGIFNPGINEMNVLFADQQTGDVYAGGPAADRSGARIFPDQVAKWNGYIWLPLDIDLQTSDVSAIVQSPDRTLYLGGAFNGTAFAAGVATLINTGIGEAYPTVKLRNISSTTIRPYQLINTLTGDALYFDLTFEPGEELTLTTEPGGRSFTSSFQGNIFGAILPGSNISSFRLMPGTNYISLFCNSGSVAASIYWTPRSDSVDGGTVY